MSTQQELPRYTPHLFGKPLPHCPECRSADLEAVVETETSEVHFFCRGCGRCWHVELGYVHRVVPASSHAARPLVTNHEALG